MRVDKMRLSVLTFVMCAFAQTNATDLTRVTRTLPFGLSPSTWPGSFGNLWPLGRFWQLPKATANSLFRLVASPDTRTKMVYEFGPEDGARAAYEYQRRYGYRGERLIELVGAGYHPDYLARQQIYFQPMPPTGLVPPRPSF